MSILQPKPDKPLIVETCSNTWTDVHKIHYIPGFKHLYIEYQPDWPVDIGATFQYDGWKEIYEIWGTQFDIRPCGLRITSISCPLNFKEEVPLQHANDDKPWIPTFNIGKPNKEYECVFSNPSPECPYCKGSNFAYGDIPCVCTEA